jgi:molybdopterin-guanine dinucleotide biosynthesis protein
LLKQWTNYNIGTTVKSNLKQLIVETENAIQQIDTNQQDAIRHLSARNIRTLMSKHNTTAYQHKQQFQLIKNIKQKIHEHNITLAEADKGKTMVILYKRTLNEKVNQFINDNHIETLTSDPTQKMQRQIQNTLKHSNTLFKKNKKKLMLQMNPAAPTLRAKVKIHKPQTPIRPVINNISAPSYKLARHTHYILKELLKLKYEFNCTNSVTFAEDITKVHI